MTNITKHGTKDRFDFVYYITNNPDVVSVHGNDVDSLWNHFVIWGQNEDRLWRFNGKQYSVHTPFEEYSSVTLSGAIRDDIPTALNEDDGDVSVLKVNSVGALHTTNSTIDSIAKTEDTAHATGDKGIMPLAIYKSTGASLAGTDGDYTPLQVNNNGSLRIVNETEFNMDVSMGKIQNVRHVTINGFNTDIDTIAEESIISRGGSYVFPTDSEIIDIVSTSASDASGGVGATTVQIEGLNSSYGEISEIVTMDGLSIASTDNAYLRINRLVVITSGSTTWNVGIITATQTTSGLVLRSMPATYSIDHDCVYTVPLSHSMYCRRLRYSTTTAGGTNPVVIFKFYVTVGGTRYLANELFLDSALTANYDDSSFSTDIVTQTSDINIVASTDKNNTTTKIQLRCLLINNDYI